MRPLTVFAFTSADHYMRNGPYGKSLHDQNFYSGDSLMSYVFCFVKLQVPVAICAAALMDQVVKHINKPGFLPGFFFFWGGGGICCYANLFSILVGPNLFLGGGQKSLRGHPLPPPPPCGRKPETLIQSGKS